MLDSEAVGAESADCTGGRNLTYVQASCPFRAFPQVNGDMIEILVTIDFPEVPSDSQVYLRIGGSTDPAGTVATAEPIGLGPGSNIHGTSSLVAKRRLMNVNNANAIFGMSNVSKENSKIQKFLTALPQQLVLFILGYQCTRPEHGLAEFTPEEQ